MAYEKKTEKYQNYKSTGIMLIVFGMAGLLFILISLLNCMKIINISFLNNSFININGATDILYDAVMTLVFLMFFLYGIFSIIKSVKFKSEISNEESKIENIKSYIHDNFTYKFFADKFGETGDEIYYDRTDFIRNEINKKFELNDEKFKDHIIEELYQEIFESDDKI